MSITVNLSHYVSDLTEILLDLTLFLTRLHMPDNIDEIHWVTVHVYEVKM